MTRRLYTEYVNSASIKAILANHLIPLHKGGGVVQPIGVGEVIQRIIAKCVTKATKQDVIGFSGSLQVCVVHKSGSVAAIHVMGEIIMVDETDATLLIDSSNAFNSLNRAAALHNQSSVPYDCYLCNQYLQSACSFIYDWREGVRVI